MGTLQEDRKERTRAPSATQAPAGSGPGPAGRAAPVFSELGPQGHRWPPLQWDRERVTEQRRPVQRDQASGGAGRGACLRQGLRMRGLVRLRLSRAAVRKGHAPRRDQLVRRPSGVAGQWAGAAAPPPQVLGSGEAQPRSAGSRFWTWSLRRRVPAGAKNFKSSRSPNTGSTLIVSPPSFEANVGKPLGRCAHITHTHTSTCSFEHRTMTGHTPQGSVGREGVGGTPHHPCAWMSGTPRVC